MINLCFMGHIYVDIAGSAKWRTKKGFQSTGCAIIDHYDVLCLVYQKEVVQDK